MSRIRAYVDLLRLHFVPAWVLIYTAGFMTGVLHYGGFSWGLLAKVVLIAAFGFEAGMVLNDYVDRRLDQKDVDPSLTRYYRPFHTRPLARGLIPSRHAFYLTILLATIALILVLTLPSPHRWYVTTLMLYAYLVEYFYQVKKRRQSYPIAQIVGRTDFALFPVAGYLVVGHPDLIAFLYFVSFYFLAQMHLAVNDLGDLKNDEVRELLTIPRLYGINGTLIWIWSFLILHLILAPIFLKYANPPALPGYLFSFILLIFTAHRLPSNPIKNAQRLLPLVHLALAIQALSLILTAF